MGILVLSHKIFHVLVIVGKVQSSHYDIIR
jgi:hypothetical protein